jgi:hypothetical protein
MMIIPRLHHKTSHFGGRRIELVEMSEGEVLLAATCSIFQSKQLEHKIQ